jgi:hypothetical protein
MATEHTHDPMVNPETGYEKQDLSYRGILVFFAFLFIAGVVIHIVIWAMYMGFDKYARANEAPTSPLAPTGPPIKAGMLQNTPMVNLERFAVPRLQSNDVWDMNTFRLQEEKVLNAEAYETDGVVHLPINAAMQALVQRGLPVRADAVDPSHRNPQVVPTGAGFVGWQQVMEKTVEGGEGQASPSEAPQAKAQEHTSAAESH